jgi:hypothetical protein
VCARMDRKEKITDRIPSRDLYEEHLVIVDSSPFFILQRGFLINHLHSIICLSCMSIPFLAPKIVMRPAYLTGWDTSRPWHQYLRASLRPPYPLQRILSQTEVESIF